MNKSLALVIAAILLACVGFTGAALAAEISTNGTIGFKLIGANEEDKVGGIFGAEDVLPRYSLTLTWRASEADLIPEFGRAKEALMFDAAYTNLYDGADIEKDDWYSSRYEAKRTYSLGTLSVTAEMRSFSPGSVVSFFNMIEEFREEKGQIEKLLWFQLQLPVTVLPNRSTVVSDTFYRFRDAKGGNGWIRK